jgi:hypothetical protein
MRYTVLSPLKVKCLASVILHLLLIASPSNGQTKEKEIRKIYGQAGFGTSALGGYLTDWSILAVFKNNCTVSFSILDIRPKPDKMDVVDEGDSWLRDWVPYVPDTRINQVIGRSVTDCRVTVYSVTGGKCFEWGRSAWVTTEAGVLVVQVEEVTHKLVARGGTFYPDPNYKPESEKLTGGGVLFKADLNWAFSSFVGMGVGTFLGFNSTGNPAGLAGIEIKAIVGRMYRKSKGKARNWELTIALLHGRAKGKDMTYE